MRVTDVRGPVRTVSGRRIPSGRQTGVLPAPQRRRFDADAPRNLPDRKKLSRNVLGGNSLCNRPLDGIQGQPIGAQFGMAVVDECERLVDGSSIDRCKHGGRDTMTVAWDEGEERAQRGRMDEGVDAISRRRSVCCRQYSGGFVVANGLGREPVFAGEIDGSVL